MVWVSEPEGPKVAVMVASRVLLSGVERSGVSVIVSVTDWPTASEPGVKPVTVSPDDPPAVRLMLFSGTLPTLVSVIVSVIPAPGSRAHGGRSGRDGQGIDGGDGEGLGLGLA